MAQLPGEGKAGAVRPLLGSGPSSGREDNRVRKERSAVLCCEPEATLNPGGVFDLDSALHTHAAVLQSVQQDIQHGGCLTGIGVDPPQFLLRTPESQ